MARATGTLKYWFSVSKMVRKFNYIIEREGLLKYTFFAIRREGETLRERERLLGSHFCRPSKCIGKEVAIKYFLPEELKLNLFWLGFPNYLPVGV